MAHYRKLDWTQPDGDGGSYFALSPMTQHGMSIHHEEGQWWASWDLDLPGMPSAEPLMEEGQKAHENWLNKFVDAEAEAQEHQRLREDVAMASDWLAARIKRLKDYGESKGIWPDLMEVLQAEVVLGDEPPCYEKKLVTARHKASDAEKRADKNARKVKDLRRTVSKLEGRIEDAVNAVTETAPSWKHHLHAAMSALGHDFGDPDWERPDQRKRSEHLQSRLNEAEARLMGMHAMREALVECHRLASSGTHNTLGTLKSIEAAAYDGLENCSLMEYPMVVTVAVQALSWMREDRDDIKFPSYQAVDPVYGMAAFRITQVDENGMCFMVANGRFSKHADLHDAKVCAEEISRDVVQKALLPHIRVMSRQFVESEPNRASKAALAAADHPTEIGALKLPEMSERLEHIEDILLTMKHGWQVGADVDRMLVQIGGPVASQLRHAVHSHDLGAAYDALQGRLLLGGGWKMLEFENASQSDSWVCRLLAATGQEVSSSLGQETPQDSPAHAMVCAMLWAMRLELRRALGLPDEAA